MIAQAAEAEVPALEGWAILELMGHRRLAGVICEQTIAGAPFIRIDVPALHDPRANELDQPAATQFYAAGAIYAITPTTEAVALEAAKTWRPQPVQRWELPALLAPSIPQIDPVDWLLDSDHERLYHAISVVRHGRAGLSDSEDEQLARGIVQALRGMRQPADDIATCSHCPHERSEHTDSAGCLARIEVDGTAAHCPCMFGATGRDLLAGTGHESLESLPF